MKKVLMLCLGIINSLSSPKLELIAQDSIPILKVESECHSAIQAPPPRPDLKTEHFRPLDILSFQELAVAVNR